MKISRKFINLISKHSKNCESSENENSSFIKRGYLHSSKSMKIMPSEHNPGKNTIFIPSVFTRKKEKPFMPIHRIKSLKSAFGSSTSTLSCSNNGSILRKDFILSPSKYSRNNPVIKLKSSNVHLMLSKNNNSLSNIKKEIINSPKYKTPKVSKSNPKKSLLLKCKSELNEDQSTLYAHYSRSFTSKSIRANLKSSINTVLSSSLSSLLTKKNNQDIINKEMTMTHLLTSFQFSISLKVLDLILKNYPKTVYSNNNSIKGYIKGFAGNTYQGLYPKENFNRVKMVLNICKPSKIDDTKIRWPDTSIFSLYDGFYGQKCVSYLFEHLHQNILKSPFFLKNYAKGINDGYSKSQNNFTKMILENVSNNKIDKSGCCLIDIFIIDSTFYVVNLGDSNVLISKNNFQITEQLTTPHDITNIFEKTRILRAGGNFLTGKMNQNCIPKSSLADFPFCELVKPGNFKMTRALGVVESSLKNPKLILHNPDINSYVIERDIDFLFIGNKEIFRNLTNKDVFECIKLVFSSLCEHNEYNCKTCIHEKCKNTIDIIIKTAQYRGGFGNLSCIFILFNENLGFNFCSSTYDD